MLGRMCRIPVGMNELALLSRVFSALILLRFQLPSPFCSTAQRAGNSQAGWKEGGMHQYYKRERDLEGGEKKEAICI